jgi:hypothetical protein
VIIWLGRTLDFRRTLLVLRDVNYAWVSAGLLAVLLTLWARVLRWQALLDCRDLAALGTLRALVLGQLVNLILPARLGDLGRAYLVARAGYPSQAQALGTVALEKLWDVALLIGLIFGLSLWHPLPAWVTIPARVAAVASGALLAGVVVLLVLRRHLSVKAAHWERRIGMARWQHSTALGWLGRFVGRLLDGLGGLHNPRLMALVGGWSLVVWSLGALTNLALLKAFALPPSMEIALFILAVLQVGVSVPSLPGRFGVFEGLCLAVLAAFGVDANLALGYGLVLHLVVLLPPVALGVWWLLRLDSAARRLIWSPT